MSVRDVPGAAKTVSLIEDTGSDVVRELVRQHNEGEITINKNIVAGNGLTARAILGRWRTDAWVKDLSFLNPNAVALASLTTSISIKRCAADDADMVTGPAAATTILGLTGFDTGGLAAGKAQWGNEFVQGTNITAKTGSDRRFIVPAGEILYAELVNNEGAVPPNILIEVCALVSIIDRIELNPGNLQDKPMSHTRNRRKTRAS